METRLAASTVYSYIKVLRHFYQFVCIEDSKVNNPFSQFKAHIPKRKAIPVLYEKEINQLYAKLLQSNRISNYQRFLFEFIYNTGVKPSEMSRLTLTDIDFVTRSIVVTANNGKQRYVFYSKSMEFLLLNHLELRQKTLENKSLYHSYFFIEWKTGFMVNKNTIYREL